MDALTITLTILGILVTTVGVVIAIEYGRNQVNKRDANEIKSMLNTLDKKVDGMAVYMDGLPKMADKGRRELLSAGLKAMQEFKWDEAIDNFRGCLGSATKQSEKVALLGLIGNCFLSTSRLDEALGSYKEAEKIAREDNNKEGLSVVLGNMGIVYQIKGDLDKALEQHELALKINRDRP